MKVGVLRLSQNHIPFTVKDSGSLQEKHYKMLETMIKDEDISLHAYKELPKELRNLARSVTNEVEPQPITVDEVLAIADVIIVILEGSFVWESKREQVVLRTNPNFEQIIDDKYTKIYVRKR